MCIYLTHKNLDTPTYIFLAQKNIDTPIGIFMSPKNLYVPTGMFRPERTVPFHEKILPLTICCYERDNFVCETSKQIIWQNIVLKGTIL